jgi:hypothetical protein
VLWQYVNFFKSNLNDLVHPTAVVDAAAVVSLDLCSMQRCALIQIQDPVWPDLSTGSWQTSISTKF